MGSSVCISDLQFADNVVVLDDSSVAVQLLINQTNLYVIKFGPKDDGTKTRDFLTFPNLATKQLSIDNQQMENRFLNPQGIKQGVTKGMRSFTRSIIRREHVYTWTR